MSAREMEAAALTAHHIGAVVGFEWRFPTTDVRAKVTGELRQVYHTGSDTIVNLASPDTSTAGDLSEFVLGHKDEVVVGL